MAQAPRDACGEIDWAADARCLRLKGHRGLHHHHRAGRWGSAARDKADDGGTRESDQQAQRKGVFPDYVIERGVRAAQKGA